MSHRSPRGGNTTPAPHADTHITTDLIPSATETTPGLLTADAFKKIESTNGTIKFIFDATLISPGPKFIESTTTVPANATITSTRLAILNQFNNAATIDITLEEAPAQPLLTALENDPTKTSELYSSEDEVVATTGGKIRATIGGTPDTGTGEVTVTYVENYLP